NEQQIKELFKQVVRNQGIEFMVDLEYELNAGGKSYPFKIYIFRRHFMLNGLGSIGPTLQRKADISRFKAQNPAVFVLIIFS
ncbi:MAG: 3-isopropylmalate dehydratase small subunit, partial [Serratia symbiotica]|nr:3-isopropylmalate dehydratase small subunit [Serratia symbiotica]